MILQAATSDSDAGHSDAGRTSSTYGSLAPAVSRWAAVYNEVWAVVCLNVLELRDQSKLKLLAQAQARRFTHCTSFWQGLDMPNQTEWLKL